jgi:hypothetical protein
MSGLEAQVAFAGFEALEEFLEHPEPKHTTPQTVAHAPVMRL